MRIAIVGTVGVPARYGGFETLAEQLALNIDPAEHELTFYCQRSAYPEIAGGTGFGPNFAGYRRVFLPLKANGPASMVHDMLAMAHAAFKVRPDVMLVLGYSGAWFLPLVRVARPEMRIVTNIDGMEWRRDKFGASTRRLLKTLEWFATRFSHRVIADNGALVDLARKIHGIDPVLIAYGGDHTLLPPEAFLDIEPGYGFAVARIEPENNCHLILDACEQAGQPMVFVGNWDGNGYGRELKARFAGSRLLRLVDPIYDVAKLAHLRAGAGFYVHGHSVGGTNPSLVEAIFHHARIIAFDCVFNRATLAGQGDYFADVDGLRDLLKVPASGGIAAADRKSLEDRYRWRNISREYLAVLGGAD